MKFVLYFFIYNLYILTVFINNATKFCYMYYFKW